MKNIQYDIIGDIHGCIDQLQALLAKLGFEPQHSVYQHPDKKVIFLGDFIDRGPGQKAVLDIVRPMVEQGQALSVMGNHEFNAICYATPSGGDYIRTHSDKNTHQHQAFLDEFPLGSPQHQDAIAWFKTLPVYLDLPGIGVVHACWNENSFAAIQPFLNPDHSLKAEAYGEYADNHSEFFYVIEQVLKGPEFTLPNGIHFHDKDGHQRKHARIHWWKEDHLDTAERLEFSGAELTDQHRSQLNERDIDDAFDCPDKPIFIGHYWMNGAPRPLADQIACVDYSVAKGGKLAAYQWRGEKTIHADHFVWV